MKLPDVQVLTSLGSVLTPPRRSDGAVQRAADFLRSHPDPGHITQPGHIAHPNPCTVRPPHPPPRPRTPSIVLQRETPPCSSGLCVWQSIVF
ncbi:hypothetical protein CesoFtcFv8_027861 [Champsocephalus esox]|uniref:Uncharacterized protein n=1 Tax=Champsocephalus esox TaxID=159716 RepID=A0AAN8GB58_9TELE|nr:hypothetical protein CesoFtcFv8_027861 [Champsocephalus esox]